MLWSIAMMLLAAQPAPFVAGEVEAAGPHGPLRGTLVQASAARAAVVIIPGSGPTDRNGDNPLGVRAAPYRLIAEGLAKRGITSVRIDKRGMFASAGAVTDANAVTIDDYATDVRNWVTVVRKRTGVSCVWLLGHSEGGLVALAAAQKHDGICGLVLVASPGRPLGNILKQQLAANPANAALLEPADAAIDAIAAGRRVDSAALPPPLASLFAPSVQGFLISLFAIDPAKLIGSVKLPILIVQGQRDLQTSVEDAEVLKKAAPTAKLAILPNTNHVLKSVGSDDRAANLATYADPNLPLAPEVIDTIEKFLGAANH